jgi:hypothetical protein
VVVSLTGSPLLLAGGDLTHLETGEGVPEASVAPAGSKEPSVRSYGSGMGNEDRRSRTMRSTWTSTAA